MSLAIITVVYQNYTVLEDFLDSLRKQTNKNYHLFIADLSTDRKHIDLEDIPYTVITTENKGYAHGVNVCLTAASDKGYEQFCVMNDDTFFEHTFVENIHASLRDYSGTIIGGKIYYAPGYEYHKDKYKHEEKGYVLWYAGGVIDWKNVITAHRGVDEVDQGQYDQAIPTDFVTGCFMCFDKQVVDKVGLWDESYFLYYEDADYCVRAKQKGIPLYYDPSLILWHKNAQSTEGSGSMLHQKYQNKNRLLFGLKYAPLRTRLHLLKNAFFDRFI